MDVKIETTWYWRTKQGGSLSQRMLPFSFPLAYSLLFLSAAGKPLLVFRDGTSGKDSLSRKIFEQFDRCIKIIDK